MSKSVLWYLCRAIVRAASRFVPARLRVEWMREWHGELWHRIDAARAGPHGVGAALNMIRRATGAFRHALWMRRQEPITKAEPMDFLVQNLRYAMRRLRQSPGFTAMAIAIMGLGIGANTAIFSIVNAVLFRPLPYAKPSELIRIFTTEPDGMTPSAVSYLDYLEFRERKDLFSGVVVNEAAILSIIEDDGSQAVFGEFMSADYFQVLGLKPALGRAFVPDEDERPAAAAVAMMSHRTWQGRHAADPDIVGSTVRLNGVSVTIVGVGPEGFNGSMVGIASEYWMPWGTAVLVDPKQETGLQNRTRRGLFANARMHPQVSVQQVAAAMHVMAAKLAEEYPASNADRSVVVMPSNDVRLHPFIDGALYPVGAFLMVVVGLVLFVACTNLANLLLVQASARRTEVAIRLAMGASRARLVFQLLTESTLLGVFGGVVGLATAYWFANFIVSFRPPIPIPISIDLTLDGTVLAFTAILSVGTGVIFGLAPSLRASRPDLVRSLKNESTSFQRDRRFGLRNILVVSQVAVSLVLLIAAGLFVRGLGNAQRVDPGFETTQVAMATMDLDLGGYTSQPLRQEFLETIKQRMAGYPGVESVAVTDRVPLGMMLRTMRIFIDGYELPEGVTGIEVDNGAVSREYFEVLDVAILRGRNFDRTDTPTSPGVAIVSAAMARKFWNTDVVGRQFRLGRSSAGTPVEIIGIAEDVKVRTLGEDPRPYVYLPLSQSNPEFISVVARTTGDPSVLLEIFRREITAINADLPIFQLNTMEEHLGLMLFAPRMGAVLLSAFGVLAMLLASIGLYSVVAFSVAQRTREVGIRIALGAHHRQVVRLVVGEGMALVGVGVAIGLGLSLAAMRPIAGLLHGVSPTDLVTFGGVSVLLAAVALLASFIPARRAARVDPMVALRYE